MRGRFKLTRDFYLPRGVAISWTRHKAMPLEVGSYSQNGKLYSIGFYGKQAKPAWHNRHSTAERRTAHIAEMVKNFSASADYKAKRRAERLAFAHTLKVGDVLNTCWGYDQTNREFYEVTAVRGKQVVIREIGQHREYTEGYHMGGKCAPKVGEYIGPELKRLVTVGNCVKINGHITAHQYVMREIAPGVKVGDAVYWSNGH